MGDEENPKITKNIESVVDGFFGKITNRLQFLEKEVLKQLNEKTQIDDLEKSV